MPLSIQNLRVSAKDRDSMGYRVFWDDGQARFHIWLTDRDLSITRVKHNHLYKNPLVASRTGEPEFSQTARLTMSLIAYRSNPWVMC